MISIAFSFVLLRLICAQNVGSLSSPPFQYINLSNLLVGAGPPGLKDAALGYDEVSRSIIIFGGESNGFPQSQTYLLNLDTLAWSLPTPPTNLGVSPPARSAAIAASDFAASNRHSFVVIGGKGDNDAPLSDIWEFDWNNKFWASVQMSPGGPDARWRAMGGSDFRSPFHSDPSIPGPNNTLYLSGGTDGSTLYTDGLWMLELAGTLSSNLPDSTIGSWSNTPLDNFPSLYSSAGAVLLSNVVSTGTCSSSATNSCPLQNATVIDAETESFTSHEGCPAPRLGPVLVPNLNAASTSFDSEVLMLFGLYDTSVWLDAQGLERGEVDVFDTNIGSWSRVIPAGDPGSDSTAQYPTPRQGAAALAYNSGLVGTSRSSYTDTIIFGGQDQSGNDLNDLWILRAYNDQLTSSNTVFKTGSLGTGVDADGSGVENTFLPSCASRAASTPTSSQSSSPSPSTSLSPSQPNNLNESPLYNIPTVHKVLSSASVGILLFAVLGLRLLPPPQLATVTTTSIKTNHSWGFLWYIVMALGWGIGIAGFSSAVSGITAQDDTASTAITKRANSQAYKPQFLQTKHGQAGFALFIALYAVIPLLVLHQMWQFRRLKRSSLRGEVGPASTENEDKNPNSPPSGSPRIGRLSASAQRLSEDSESTSSGGPARGFEVLNRHRASPTSTNAVLSSASRQLSEVDWLQRRRTLNTVGELDYAISQVLHAHPPPTPAQEALLSSGKEASQLALPPLSTVLLHLFFHAVLLGICSLALIALWLRGPSYAFALFLAWTILFYVAVFISSWRQWSASSVLSVLIFRLRAPSIPSTLPSDQPSQDQTPLSNHLGDRITPTPGARSIENDEDEDIDEDTQQRRIEEEMDRRQVSIVTIPKRKLWITNPELHS